MATLYSNGDKLKEFGTKVTGEEFKRWFPAASNVAGSKPALRIICFAGAGMEHSIYSGQGTKLRPQPNPFTNFCKFFGAQLLSVQLPGRAMRRNEAYCKSPTEVACQLIQLLHPFLQEKDDVPYVICAHSIGCICAYEFAVELTKRNLKRPSHLYLSCMVSPDTPRCRCPWRKASDCDAYELQCEMKEWGANPELFHPDIWVIYEDLIRADLALFDDYTYNHDGKPLDIPASLFYATDDTKVSKESMLGWRNILSNGEESSAAAIRVDSIKGPHNFFYDASIRKEWMDKVVTDMKKYMN